VILVGAACGDDDDTAAQAPTNAADEGGGSDRSAALQNAELGAVLEALAQDHDRARATIGPHRLGIQAALALAPEGEPKTTEPAVGEPRPVADAVKDDIRIVWASAPESEPRLSISQHNDHDHGRDVVVADERMYTRHEHRNWYVQPLQSDIYELWLDDAQHAVHDVVSLAAPRLQLAAEAKSGEGLAGGDAIAIALSLADTTDAKRIVNDGTRAWRADAEITAVEGEIVLDARSGLWLRADVRVRYAVPGPDGRPLRGDAHIRGSVEPLSPESATAEIDNASDWQKAEPLLERTRYEVERARLLDGLAGR